MIELKLEPHDSKLLRQPSAEFDFQRAPYDPAQLAYAMVKVMVDYGGYGLSGCQVGVPYRVFVIRSTPNYAAFNPRLVDLSGDQEEAMEGCLSFPGVGVTVKRYKRVRLRYQTVSGATATSVFEGITARIVQHEVDHLEGLTLFDHLRGMQRQFAMKKWAKRVIDGRVTPRKLDAVDRAAVVVGIEGVLAGQDLEKIARAAIKK
jgi:peptide deformylase